MKKKRFTLAIFIHLLKAFANLDLKELLNKLELYCTPSLNYDSIITLSPKENNSFQLNTKYKLITKIYLVLKGIKEIICLQLDSNPERHSSIWPKVYELCGFGFQSSCSHSNFRFHACFEQGVPWHSGNYRVWDHSEMRTWRDKKIHSNNLPSISPKLKINALTIGKEGANQFLSILRDYCLSWKKIHT